MNKLGSFLQDCCSITGPTSPERSTIEDLYKSFQAWAKTKNFREMSEKTFAIAIRETPGIEERRTPYGKFLYGISTQLLPFDPLSEIKARMGYLNLSQVQLAERVYVSQSFMSELLRGTRPMHPQRAQAIFTELDMPSETRHLCIDHWKRELTREWDLL